MTGSISADELDLVGRCLECLQFDCVCIDEDDFDEEYEDDEWDGDEDRE